MDSPGRGWSLSRLETPVRSDMSVTKDLIDVAEDRHKRSFSEPLPVSSDDAPARSETAGS